MISLFVRIHIFLNGLAFLRLVLLSLFLQSAVLAKRDSFGTSITLLQKRAVFSGVYFDGVCNITLIRCAPKLAFFYELTTTWKKKETFNMRLS